MRTGGLLLIALAMAAAGCAKPAAAGRSPAAVAPLGSPSAPGTSREDLERTVEQMTTRLAASPDDAPAAVRLADALIRQSRTIGDAGLAVRAERVLLPILKSDPDRYDARRMLALALLSQHRFPEAIREAERCLQLQPRDVWPWGVIGDSRLELGEIEAAFEAFDRMAAARPNATSYARVSYAHELQGNLDEAARFMTMALESTSPSDVEALAWHRTQLGALELARGRPKAAEREFAHALHLFPEYPAASEGLAKATVEHKRRGAR